ncbi:hypothetical protein SARC_13328 [Sphaeroforma arctica JP610]|uniref:Uncharacterized protein n=1 Tax=Sphaeroforma arctica JP610 TaxID=667725 RepID=A0A0L0FCE0_9EUKA|nr:hypothetical protein SARC_13328 [Sphaeroforma arctica JP610]KNC74116.1 hypothetical protein SARC_13328 [Sphaeroforma arctica JP610]|eukprot:XP_014148018.1 hypothetical protein SARC_13328 [Sphaeroforma arctica JP610]
MSFFKKVGDALTHGVKDVKDGIKDFESKPRSSPKMDKSSGRSSTKTSIKLPSAKPFVSRKGDEETQKQLKQFAANSLRADSVAMRKVSYLRGIQGPVAQTSFLLLKMCFERLREKTMNTVKYKKILVIDKERDTDTCACTAYTNVHQFPAPVQ